MRTFAFGLLSCLAILICSAPAIAQTAQITPSAKPAPPPQTSWTTVVNNGTTMPGAAVTFNSYNQPSVNGMGTVVFRARSKGGSGSPTVHGIYLRNMLAQTPVQRIFDKTTEVPDPNNNGVTFIEFPAFPRIDIDSATFATRGRSQPVLTYVVNGEKTQAGTSEIFAPLKKGYVTAASQLGNAPGYSYFAVPGEAEGTRFDEFPGAPSVSGDLVVFKGNYTVGTDSKTGIYYHDIASKNGKTDVERIADSSTLIPVPEPSENEDITFGATAPPSAAQGKVVFTGWDNEETPTMGGIYLATISPDPPLTALVSIGDQVPGEDSGVTFTNFGENLAFDGRYVGFWASWGSDYRPVTLECPTDGNKDLIQFCNDTYPGGHQVLVPVHQGIFVYDTESGATTALAKTSSGFNDFLYWVFSGKPPANGSDESEDGEPARWRSAAFVAVSTVQSGSQTSFRAAFKAQRGNGDGIYLAPGLNGETITTLIDTKTSGISVDPDAPEGSDVVTLGIEREGYRDGWLVVTASMLNSKTSESWGGIYIRKLP